MQTNNLNSFMSVICTEVEQTSLVNSFEKCKFVVWEICSLDLRDFQMFKLFTLYV